MIRIRYFHNLFEIDHSCASVLGHSLSDMKKEPSPKQALVVRCPTCGAAPEEKCELSTGQPRTNPHRDRRLIAKEYAESAQNLAA
jgi:hypothetical protein